MKNLTLTKTTILLLRDAYEKAVQDGVEQFVFDGHALVTNYAKYLLEYADSHTHQGD